MSAETAASSHQALERMGGKIRTGHLERLAVVYVRQSTMQQVDRHRESTRLQYALVDRAIALGWARSQVIVIDEASHFFDKSQEFDLQDAVEDILDTE